MGSDAVPERHEGSDGVAHVLLPEVPLVLLGARRHTVSTMLITQILPYQGVPPER